MKDEYDLSGGVRGPVLPTPPGVSQVRIRLDDEVLDWFRKQVHAAGGGDYGRWMNDVLLAHVRRGETLEQMLRRVIREEIAAVRTRQDPDAGAVTAA